jgi:hypothetical protein
VSSAALVNVQVAASASACTTRRCISRLE